MIRLKELRAKKGTSQSEVAKFLGITQQAYANYEREARQADYETIQKLADYFKVSVDYLLGRESARADMFESEEIVYYEIIGTVRAGYDGNAVETCTGETTPIPISFLKGHNVNDFFVLRVSGDSMYPKLLDGDLVFVQRCSSVDSGSTAVILYNGDEATVKKVKYVNGEDWLEMIPCNPEYQTKRIEGSDLEDCRVLGKVVKLIRDI